MTNINIKPFLYDIFWCCCLIGVIIFFILLLSKSLADTEIKLVKKGKSNFTSINSNKPCTFCQKWLGKDHAALALCEYLDRNKVSIAVILVLCTIGGSAWYVSKYGIPACLCWWSTKNKKRKGGPTDRGLKRRKSRMRNTDYQIREWRIWNERRARLHKKPAVLKSIKNKSSKG